VPVSVLSTHAPWATPLPLILTSVKRNDMSTATDTTYNGWANWATWNVALWLSNDETTYKVAQRYDSYDRLIPRLEMMWGQMTPDGARWMDGTIDTAALDEMLADL
jgi:hypothetical protein